MRSILRGLVLVAALGGTAGVANAGRASDTVSLFRDAGKSATFFDTSYGYAVFPNIGKGGLGIGAEYGKGYVYSQGKLIGRTSVTQLSIGLQAGGEDFSEIIFFKDRRALDNFTSGNFAFGADATAIAITVSASAGADTTGGAQAAASGDMNDARTAGEYHDGVAVFTIAKGGLMGEVAIAGEKFSYRAGGTRVATADE